MRAWHADGDPIEPRRRRDRNGPTAENAAAQRPTMLVRQPLRFGAVAAAPWRDRDAPPDFHHRCLMPAERRGLRPLFVSAASRFRQFVNAGSAAVGQTVRL